MTIFVNPQYQDDFETYKRVLEQFVRMLGLAGWKGRVPKIPCAEQYFGDYRLFGWFYRISDKKKARAAGVV